MKNINVQSQRKPSMNFSSKINTHAQKKIKNIIKNIQKPQPYEISSISFQFVDSESIKSGKQNLRTRAKSQQAVYLPLQNNQIQDDRNISIYSIKPYKIFKGIKRPEISQKQIKFQSVQDNKNEPLQLNKIEIKINPDKKRLNNKLNKEQAFQAIENTEFLHYNQTETNFLTCKKKVSLPSQKSKGFQNIMVLIQKGQKQLSKSSERQGIKRDSFHSETKLQRQNYQIMGKTPKLCLNSPKKDSNVYKLLSQTSKFSQKLLSTQIREHCRTQVQDQLRVRKKVSFLQEKKGPLYYYRKIDKVGQQMNEDRRKKSGVSRSVMINKIINLRKMFNDKYRKSGSVSISTDVFDHSRDGWVNHESQKKLSFQQLFHRQKQRLKLLRRLQTAPIQTGDIGQGWRQYIQHQQMTQKQSNKDIEHLKEQRLETILAEDNDGSISTQRQPDKVNIVDCLSDSYESGVCPVPVQQNEPSFSPIKTYTFDHIHRRKIHKSQVNDLRHKYLHAKDNEKKVRKISKDDSHTYGISILPVYDKTISLLKQLTQQYNMQITNSGIANLSTSDLQIKRNERMTFNLPKKTKLQDIQRKTQQLKGSFKQFEPWNAQDIEQQQDHQFYAF